MNCEYCQKGYEKEKAYTAHVRLCPLNPGRYVFSEVDKEKQKKNATRFNTSVLRLNKLKEKFKNGELVSHQKGKLRTQEEKDKISETMKKNPKAGGLREGSGRGVKQWYESAIAGRVYLRSTYELEYVKWLDKNNIIWKANLTKFPFIWEEKTRYYYPDFYLIDEECYVEIKGYETSKDIAKWRDFPYKLKVLKLEDLKKLGLLL